MITLDIHPSSSLIFDKLTYGNDELIILRSPLKGYHFLNMSLCYEGEDQALLKCLIRLYKDTHGLNYDEVPQKASSYFKPCLKVRELGLCYLHKRVRCSYCLDDSFGNLNNPVLVEHDKYDGVYLGWCELSQVIGYGLLSNKDFVLPLLKGYNPLDISSDSEQEDIDGLLDCKRRDWRDCLESLVAKEESLSQVNEPFSENEEGLCKCLKHVHYKYWASIICVESVIIWCFITYVQLVCG